jgi:hypothetical protein
MITLLVLVASLGLRKKRDSELLIYVQTIVNTLKDNPNFPGVQTELLAVKAQADIYELALNKVKHGPAGAAELKNQERATLENMMRELSNNCLTEAAGDAAKFLSSGFSLKRTPVKHEVLPAPTEFAVFTQTIPGQVVVRFSKVAGGLTYELWASKVGEAMKHIATLTDSRSSYIYNLESRTNWQFKLRAIGAKGLEGAFSETVEVPVLYASEAFAMEGNAALRDEERRCCLCFYFYFKI